MNGKDFEAMILAAIVATALVSGLILLCLSRWEVMRLKDAITALVGAVNDNTAAIKAALAAGFSDPADVTSVRAATTVLQENTAALVAATPAPTV